MGEAAVVAYCVRQEDHSNIRSGRAHCGGPAPISEMTGVVLKAADMMDKVGNKTAQLEIA